MKIQVHELARELQLSSAELIHKLENLGIDGLASTSVLPPLAVQRVRRAIAAERPAGSRVVVERLRPTVVRRRSVSSKPAANPAPAPALAPAAPAHSAAQKLAASAAESRPESTKADGTRAPSPVGAVPSRDAEPRHVPDVPAGPLPAAVRFAQADLPPGVIARGRLVAPGVSSEAAERAKQAVVVAARRRESRVMTPARPRRGRPGQRVKAAPRPAVQRPAPIAANPPSAHKRVIRIDGDVELKVLAQRMNIKVAELLAQLLKLGASGLHINSTLDLETAQIIAAELGWSVENQQRSEAERVAEARGTAPDREQDRTPRPPVVTVMGHVDHGKTSLLDRIRKSDVASHEAGGITQHIGAYRVDTEHGTVVFLDTPGHEAFTAMRARGAGSTDVVVLVVAADDGVMPQTREAVHHAKAASVPVVVAINKIDRPKARPEPIMTELAAEGLTPEAWGGDTLYVQCSAATGQGVPELLRAVLLQAEMLQLRTNPKLPAVGVVLEAYVDRGRGPVANVLLRDGVLARGDFVVAGRAFGRVRAMNDDRGKPLKLATPTTPAEVLGLSEPPAAGDVLYAVAEQRHARELAERRSREAQSATRPMRAPRSLADLKQLVEQGELPMLNLVVKADVQGSAEALRKVLSELSTDQVKVEVIHDGVGAIGQNDVALASASSAIVIGFGVRADSQAAALAKRDGVEIRHYRVIYDVVADVKRAMAGLLAPLEVERELGSAEVRQIFRIPKHGTVAGCMVTAGKLSRAGRVRVLRDGVQVWEGRIAGLRRFKEDVREVTSGHECGLSFDGFGDVKERDVIQAYQTEQVEAA